ncbi:MAG: ferrous iron transport protein B [Desulfohalobiaceae bacterium]
MLEPSLRIALAGQPNSGKSTVFNLLTGARQHIANYPGVTVEKKLGFFSQAGHKVEITDLPGTYSLSTFSLEERVARDFLLEEQPDAVVQVADAANLKRHLSLFLQLAEIGLPLILVLNKMDVARKDNINIDLQGLSRLLGVPVLPVSARYGQGRNELKQTIIQAAEQKQTVPKVGIDYGPLEPAIENMSHWLQDHQEVPSHLPVRWLAIKLLENDPLVWELFQERGAQAQQILQQASDLRAKIQKEQGEAPERLISISRFQQAANIGDRFIQSRSPRQAKLTDRIDSIVCHKLLGPVILVAVIYLLYELSIVQGYKITDYTWPLLAGFKNLVVSFLPQPEFLFDPILRSFGIWFMDSVNALLNYIPIFIILFALIAFLEDVGYMPRMAFLMDRLFNRFGLHGQSTLPMVLGGVYVGGCAVPAVMSTKGIPDDRARLATILIIPMLNCLAKVPLYILLVNAYFPDHKGPAMFFISTITLFMALPVAKFLSLTMLRKRETAPFIMEMPSYHLPTIKGVLGRSLERTWLFVRKIVTIVAAVAVIVFVLLYFPGLSQDREQHFEQHADQAVTEFQNSLQDTEYANTLSDQDSILALLSFQDDYKQARRGVSSKEQSDRVNKDFKERNPEYYQIVKRGRKPAEARQAGQALKALDNERRTLRREIRSERIDASFLGQLGRAMEPVTQWAGFNWRINVSLLSALAAKESLVATLGSIYQQDESDTGSLENRMRGQEKDFTALHALALMLFMALYPPCLATLIGIKIQTLSSKWMLFSLLYQISLGIVAAVLVFSGGQFLGLTGLQAMFSFYALMVTVTIGMGLIPDKRP